MQNTLIVDIYRTGRVDCSLNGISKRHNTVALICPEGYISLEDASKNAYPIVKVVSGPQGYLRAVECDKDGNVIEGWAMMGGTFIYSSDSRFREHISEYPVPLHDRRE